MSLYYGGSKSFGQATILPLLGDLAMKIYFYEKYLFEFSIIDFVQIW